MTVRNKYGGRARGARERLVWLYQLAMCTTRPYVKLSNSRQDIWRPPNLQICNAMQSEGLRQKHVLRRTAASRVAVEGAGACGPTLPFVCVHARAHAAPPRAAIPSLWESHDRDLGGRRRQREREKTQVSSFHSASLLQAGIRCASREYVHRRCHAACCRLRQSSKC